MWSMIAIITACIQNPMSLNLFFQRVPKSNVTKSILSCEITKFFLSPSVLHCLYNHNSQHTKCIFRNYINIYIIKRRDQCPVSHQENISRQNHGVVYVLVIYAHGRIKTSPDIFCRNARGNVQIGSPYCLNPLLRRHDERDGVSNHQPHDCLLNR